MGELTERDDDIIRVPEILQNRSVRYVATLLLKIFRGQALPDCPECVAREKKKILEKYEADTPEEDRNKDDKFKLFDSVEIPMKMDSRTKHFICKKCGLYATREQVSDIKERLNRRESTREDRQDDYLEWWQKSKKDKQQR